MSDKHVRKSRRNGRHHGGNGTGDSGSWRLAMLTAKTQPSNGENGTEKEEGNNPGSGESSPPPDET